MNVVNILDKIEKSGFEAYIVGGYVRDYILGLASGDIDICTNARVKDLLHIFKDFNLTSNEYGAVKILTNNLRIDITTYRRDIRYNGSRRKVEIEYVDNLIDDIKRRDFTMNTLCMNKDKQIIDILNGRQDIEAKLIRCVGDAKQRMQEDPLRMLRAVRFACLLDFKMEDILYEVLKSYPEWIETLSKERIKEEITKILTSNNALKGLKMLKELNFLKYIGIDYPDNIVCVSDICGMYSQLMNVFVLPLSKEEKKSIKQIKEIVKRGYIDEETIFTYGLYTAIVAGSILGIDKDEIYEMDKDLAIHRYKDIAITSDEIMNILDIKQEKYISLVYDDLKTLILSKRILNDFEKIKAYLISNRRKYLDEGENG